MGAGRQGKRRSLVDLAQQELLLRSLSLQIPLLVSLFLVIEEPGGQQGMWESYFFCFVLLIEFVAVFMPGFLSSEVGHAYSPELHFLFAEEEQSG